MLCNLLKINSLCPNGGSEHNCWFYPIMGSFEHSLSECTCMCGKGKFKVSYRVPDKGREGIEHLWENHCAHCKDLYLIEKRGHLIGVVKKADELDWLKKSKLMGKEKAKPELHKPKFIKILYEVNDTK